VLDSYSVVNNNIIFSRHTSVYSVARVALNYASSYALHLSPKALLATEECSKDKLNVLNKAFITRTIIVSFVNTSSRSTISSNGALKRTLDALVVTSLPKLFISSKRVLLITKTY
jgi:hypothetical protein